MDMTYLDQIIDESMRLNPPVATIHRELNCDYQLSNGATLPKGLQVIIPVLGFHHDNDIFANPHIFDPERFSQEEKKKRHAFSYIPFGEGENFSRRSFFRNHFQFSLTYRSTLLHWNAFWSVAN